MALPEGIESNPKVMLGKPLIHGTRIPVELNFRTPLTKPASYGLFPWQELDPASPAQPFRNFFPVVSPFQDCA
jgi:hypothetical protein